MLPPRAPASRLMAIVIPAGAAGRDWRSPRFPCKGEVVSSVIGDPTTYGLLRNQWNLAEPEAAARATPFIFEPRRPRCRFGLHGQLTLQWLLLCDKGLTC